MDQKYNSVPIVFAIDNNVVMQCGVTITSLLMNAFDETYYDIYILCDGARLGTESIFLLSDAFKGSERYHLSFVDVGDAFQETKDWAKGHVTSATYYRLLIPTLFPQFDKIIYADIDIIFQQDLYDLYQGSLQNGELLGAALDLSINDEFYIRSDMPSKVGKSEKDYFNAGFLVMNLKRMREEGVVESFLDHSKIQYDQNDQDILNIVCNGRVQILPSLYNFQLNHFMSYMWGREQVDISFKELFQKATLHYTWKNKPWNSLDCVAYDTWWHYYKMSPFFDPLFYFSRQQKQIEAFRNDYHNRTNGQLFRRILANIKHKLIKR